LNVEVGGGSLIIFRAPRSTGDVEESAPAVSQDYCRARELAERAAAKDATCTRAREIHQELAQAFARMAQAKTLSHE